MQARIAGGWLPERHHFSRQPGNERIRTARRPGEQDAHGEVRERNLQQEKPELTAGQHHGGYRQQARNGPGHDLADEHSKPDGRQPGHQASVTAVEQGGGCVGGHGQPDRLGQIPARREKQPQRPGDFQVSGRAGSGGGLPAVAGPEDCQDGTGYEDDDADCPEDDDFRNEPAQMVSCSFSR